MSSWPNLPMLEIIAESIPKEAIPSPFTADDISFKSITFDPDTKERTIMLHFSRLSNGEGADDIITGETIIIEYFGAKNGFTYGLYRTGLTLFGRHLNLAIPYAGWITRSRTTVYQKVDTHRRSGGNEFKKSNTWDRR